jgi:hypothetical protein
VTHCRSFRVSQFVFLIVDLAKLSVGLTTYRGLLKSLVKMTRKERKKERWLLSLWLCLVLLL